MEKEYWFVIISAILYGTITAGGQFFVNLGLSLFEISLYPLFFMSLFFLPFVLIKRQYLIKKERILFFVIYGLVGALAQLFQFGGIVLGVPVAVVALLLYTQPIWTTFLGKLMLNEKITSRKILAVGFALIGIGILLESWSIESADSIAGIISALLGGFFISLWIILGRKCGIIKQHYITTTAGWAFFSVFWLLLLWPILTLFIHEPTIIRLSTDLSFKYWFYLIVFAFTTSIIPALLFFRGIQKIEAFTTGIILLLEPISAALLAAIFFFQPIDLSMILGGFFILLSNYLVIFKLNID